MASSGRRSPLTGEIRVEFVDMAPSHDSSAPAEFGIVDQQIDPRWLADPRLPEFLRWLADSIESDQRPEDQAEFPEPWVDLRPDEEEAETRAGTLEAELARQLGESHVLHGDVVEAIAACRHCDAVMFRLGDGRYASVEMVWNLRRSDVAGLPSTTIHDVWASAAAYLRSHDPR